MSDVNISTAIVYAKATQNDYLLFQDLFHGDKSIQDYFWSEDNLNALSAAHFKSIIREAEVSDQHICDDLMRGVISVKEYAKQMSHNGDKYIGDLTPQQVLEWFENEGEGIKRAYDKGLKTVFGDHSYGEKTYALRALYTAAGQHPEFDMQLGELKSKITSGQLQIVGKMLHMPYVNNDNELLQLLEKVKVSESARISSDEFIDAASKLIIKQRLGDDSLIADMAEKLGGKAAIYFGGGHGNMFNGKNGNKDLDELLEGRGHKVCKLAMSPSVNYFVSNLGDWEEFPLTVILTSPAPTKPQVIQFLEGSVQDSLGGEVDTKKIAEEQGGELKFISLTENNLSFLPQPLYGPVAQMNYIKAK